MYKNWRNSLLIAIVSVVISACTSAPTLKEVQAMKPGVFSASVEPIPDRCGKIPEIPVNIDTDGFYSDTKGSYSTIDPILFKKWLEDTAPMKKWGQLVITWADDYRLKNDVDSGKCAVAYIEAYAVNDALLGEMKQGARQKWQSTYHQTWQFGLAASTYFKVQDLATPEQDARIRWWMAQVSKQVKAWWDRGYETKRNIYVAAAAAVMVEGVMNNDKANIDWGRAGFDYAMSNVRSDGFLHTELWRAKRSLFYHNYTAQSVVYMAELSKLIGEDWFKNEKLQRFMTAINNATLNTEVINRAANAKQEVFRPEEWGWYAALPDNDPRRVKIIEFMKVTPVVRISSGKSQILNKIPEVREFGGDYQVFRDLVEKRIN
jgi:poly(beta-D-mannuronate) lyase